MQVLANIIVIQRTTKYKHDQLVLVVGLPHLADNLEDLVKQGLRNGRDYWSKPGALTTTLFSTLQAADPRPDGLGICAWAPAYVERPAIVVDVPNQQVFTVSGYQLNGSGRLPKDTQPQDSTTFAEYVGDVPRDFWSTPEARVEAKRLEEQRNLEEARAKAAEERRINEELRRKNEPKGVDPQLRQAMRDVQAYIYERDRNRSITRPPPPPPLASHLTPLPSYIHDIFGPSSSYTINDEDIVSAPPPPTVPEE